MIVYGDKRIDEWVAGRLGLRPWSESYSIANVRDGFILGATIIHGWYPESGACELTSYSDSPRWMSREMINRVFSYVFETLGCQISVMRVSEDNTHMRNIADRLGASGYTIPRLRGRTENEIIYTYTDDQWQNSRFRRVVDGPK